jgi:amidohydrolase
MSDLLAEAKELAAFTIDLRRDFHRHPELGYREVRTAGIVARELRELGMEISTGVAETGVVGLLEGSRPGPVVLLRFDMDALPVQEQNETGYASQTAEVMHACGHDGHVAVGLTVARMLNRYKKEFCGTVKFIFQPAEEGLGGAERMIAAGILESPRPQHSLALHFWNEKPLGWLGIPSGPLMAGADLFTIRLTGKGGHAAAPHRTVDPLAAAAQVISALQTIVSRNLSPLESAVVTVARLSAGEAYNVIPQTAELAGTIRTFEEDVHARVVERIEQIVAGVSQAMGCSAEVKIDRLTPPVINDAAAAAQVTRAANTLFPGHQIDTAYRTMVSEDMACIMQEVPGCYFLVGSANSARGLDFGHHHPRFDFDEQALPWAAALMARTALDILV